MEAKILTKHPQGKHGKNIDKRDYEMIRSAILKNLKKKELTFTELADAVTKDLKGKFSKNLHWFTETVKLDLEARKIIVRTAARPQKYRMK